MTSRWSVGGMAAALVWSLAGGCGGEDGILIEVTRDDSVPASIARLAFHVGVDAVPGYPSRFVDLDPDEEVILDGRDIADDPYRLLIRPREHPGAQLMVAVVAYRRQEVLGFGALDQPVRFVDGEVAMWRIVLTRRLPDGFATSEIGCLIWTNGRGDQVAVGQGADQDCDGWASGDCNDLDPSVNPGAGEICGNAADEDCDGVTDENVDEDGDLVTTCDGDCNDAEPAVNPDATEECDGVDNDCNGLCDEGLDADGDAYTVCGSKLVDGGAFCLFDARLADCDDGAGSINPGAAEVCDGVDNDCDGACDNRDAGLDRDGDGFTACGSLADHCGGPTTTATATRSSAAPASHWIPARRPASSASATAPTTRADRATGKGTASRWWTRSTWRRTRSVPPTPAATRPMIRIRTPARSSASRADWRSPPAT